MGLKKCHTIQLKFNLQAKIQIKKEEKVKII